MFLLPPSTTIAVSISEPTSLHGSKSQKTVTFKCTDVLIISIRITKRPIFPLIHKIWDLHSEYLNLSALYTTSTFYKQHLVILTTAWAIKPFNDNFFQSELTLAEGTHARTRAVLPRSSRHAFHGDRKWSTSQCCMGNCRVFSNAYLVRKRLGQLSSVARRAIKKVPKSAVHFLRYSNWREVSRMHLNSTFLLWPTVH